MELISAIQKINLTDFSSMQLDEIEEKIKKELIDELIRQFIDKLGDNFKISAEQNPEKAEEIIFNAELVISSSNDFDVKITKIVSEMTEFMTEEKAIEICQILAT